MNTPLASNTMESSTKRYLEDHGLNRLFKDMLTCLLEDRPRDPISYMINGLQQIKSIPTSAPRPASFLHYFHGPLDTEGNEFDIEALKALSLQQQQQEEHFQSFDTGAPLPSDFITARRQSVSAESYQPRIASPEDKEEERVVIPKTDQSRKRIEDAIKGNLLFKNLDQEQRHRIIDAMFERSVPQDTLVIKQGDPGDNFYVIESGSFAVIIDGEERDRLGPGQTFGELALMYNCPRAATIKALTEGCLWAVDRQTFRSTVIDVAFCKRKLYEGFLRSVKLLATLTDGEISRIADALEPVEYNANDVIIKEGDLGQDFYIIVQGEAKVDREGQQVGLLSAGDYFGERALLEHIPRSATVTALTACKCVVLSEPAFQRLLGPLKELMQRQPYAQTQSVM